MRSLIVVLPILAIALAGCAQPPVLDEQPTASGSQSASFKACLVADKNSTTAQEGLIRAQNELGVVVGTAEVNDALPYAQAIQQLIDADCGLIIGQGSEVAESLGSAAKVNPQVGFALMDAIPTQSVPNLRTVIFNAHEVGYLAGYLAASQSTTGVVGAFGGLNEPAVTIYLDGYDQGVRRWNADHPDKQVKLVGWDYERQTGTFVQSPTSPYADPAAGRVAAMALASQDADVIFAVAGGSGEGALQFADESDNMRIIWSDEDGCLEYSQHCSVIVGSAVKARAATVVNLIRDEQASHASGIFIASLKNDGVGLIGTPIDLDPAITRDLARLREEIRAGTTRVTSPAALG